MADLGSFPDLETKRLRFRSHQRNRKQERPWGLEKRNLQMAALHKPGKAILKETGSKKNTSYYQQKKSSDQTEPSVCSEGCGEDSAVSQVCAVTSAGKLTFTSSRPSQVLLNSLPLGGGVWEPHHYLLWK